MKSTRINEKISVARDLYEKWGRALRADSGISAQLQELSARVEASSSFSIRSGVARACMLCDREEGGSCCGAGIEDRYTKELLLINLMLGVTLPESENSENSCHFLRESGCILSARDILCINYLCSGLKKIIYPEHLLQLQEVYGSEMELIFLLHDKIRNFIRREEENAQVNGKKLATLDSKPETRNAKLDRSLKLAADYFDGRKVGCYGNSGYRKTTDLSRFCACIKDLLDSGIVDPANSVFVDLGCGDGRVNLLMSYFVRLSIGIEIDSEILSEYEPRKNELISVLDSENAAPPPENIFLIHGSSLDAATFDKVRSRTGAGFEDVDLFYTYITLHDVFAEKIAERGRPGACYLVYGFSRVLPAYESFELINPDVGGRAIAALFRKKG